jgi:O-acetyl-ADP-ribose deacetylase
MHRKIGSTDVYVHSGDIAEIPVDALITAVNSGGMWYGGIDGVIERAAGNQFHRQAAAKMPLEHGQTVVARATSAHRGKWRDVVFVVDDLQGPLGSIVERALTAASTAGYETVSLPAIRTGVMLGVVEKTAAQAVQELLAGVQRFADREETCIREVHFCVFRDPNVFKLLSS